LAGAKQVKEESMQSLTYWVVVVGLVTVAVVHAWYVHRHEKNARDSKPKEVCQSCQNIMVSVDEPPCSHCKGGEEA
jgi:uncharacterized paraquat-inducible protein A